MRRWLARVWWVLSGRAGQELEAQSLAVDQTVGIVHTRLDDQDARIGELYGDYARSETGGDV